MNLAFPLIALAVGVSAAPYNHDPNVAQELRPRDGLPNVFAKIAAGETVRVAYLGGFPVQSVEGVVRHAWQAKPQTDLCFVYTIGTWMLKELQAGKQPGFGAVMETVANHYGIPSIDLGVEIAKQEADGRLVYQGTAPVEGKLVFSADGVHPGDGGHEIYRDVIARSILAMQGTVGPKPHVLYSRRLGIHRSYCTSSTPLRAQQCVGCSPLAHG